MGTKLEANYKNSISLDSKSDSLYLINNIYVDDRFYIIEATYDAKTYKILSVKPIIEASSSNKKEVKVNNLYHLKLNRIFPPKDMPFTEATNIKAPIKGEKEVFEAINLYGLFIIIPDSQY